MAKIEKALKADLPALAEMLRSKGRGRDTILAHITPREAALLKRRGGSGTTNPDTGLPEFDDFVGDISVPQDVAPVSPVYDVVQPSGQFSPTMSGTDMPIQAGLNYTPGDVSAVAPVAPTPVDTTVPTAPTAPTTYDPMQAGQEGFAYTGPQGQQISPTQTAFTPTGAGMSGADILALQQGNYPSTPAGAPGATGGGGDQSSTLSKIAAALGLTIPGVLSTLGKTAAAGGLGAYGAQQARQGAQQVQQATQEQKQIAQPYSQQGQQLVAQAQRGELTPQSQQALQAAQAQINQGIANRGGVGQQQAANQIAALYNNLLDNQYKYGLNLMNIGDNITLGAIRSGLQLDQQLQTATNQFYAQLASMVGGTGSLVR